jgi:hypothetical protein
MHQIDRKSGTFGYVERSLIKYVRRLNALNQAGDYDDNWLFVRPVGAREPFNKQTNIPSKWRFLENHLQFTTMRHSSQIKCFL